MAGNVEADGLVVSRVRHGTTVAPQRPTLPRAEVDRRLTEAARAYATLARQLGVTTEEAESAVRGQLRDSY